MTWTTGRKSEPTCIRYEDNEQLQKQILTGTDQGQRLIDTDGLGPDQRLNQMMKYKKNPNERQVKKNEETKT